jgi:hypothetical protein
MILTRRQKPKKVMPTEKIFPIFPNFLFLIFFQDINLKLENSVFFDFFP